jgi:acetyl-CoA carboxylase biotin carboxyl carrier protein
MNGRVHGTTEAVGITKGGGRIVLSAQKPGLVRGLPAVGTVLRAGDALGELEVLGVVSPLVVPAGAHGAVVEVVGDGRAKAAVGHGTTIVVLDPALGAQASAGGAVELETEGAHGLVFKTPLGGRYYARPSPGAEPFAKPGDVIETGATVALVEVMKTFHRLRYGGEGLPARAKIVRVLPTEGDDISRGTPLLELEPA